MGIRTELNKVKRSLRRKGKGKKKRDNRAWKKW